MSHIVTYLSLYLDHIISYSFGSLIFTCIEWARGPFRLPREVAGGRDQPESDKFLTSCMGINGMSGICIQNLSS